MKKLLYTILLTAISMSMYGQTNVSGGIFSNTTWTLANSPYIMTGPVVVFPNVTLTIEPGVVVKIEETSSTTSLQVYLELRGKLIAKGNASNPISFIPKTTPSNGLDYIWQGIFVKTAQGGSVDMDYIVFNNSYYGISYDEPLYDTLVFNGSKFNYNCYALAINTNLVLNDCEFKNNGVGHSLMYIYGSITARNCVYKNNYACMAFVANSVDVKNCTFEDNQSCFLQVSGKFNNCTFKNNMTVFQENGTLEIDSSLFITNDYGINGFGLGSVKNSSFLGNKIALSVGPDAVIENNIINNNDVGLGLAGSFTSGMVLPFIKDNKICYNFIYNVENKSDFNLGLENNCFCLNDSVSIDAKIYDGYDDFTRGLINFAVYDTSCINIVQRFIKINLGQSTGINQNSLIVEAYPNPFTDLINLRGLSSEENTWTIFDVTGKLILERATTNKNDALDLSSLYPGVYVMKSSNYKPIRIVKN